MKKIIIIIAILWLSLFAASKDGKPEIYSGDELKYIGMPVGGICTGQVYLGGDGQLWYWDIFNIQTLDPWGDGGCKFYQNPIEQDHKFEQGFAVKTKSNGNTKILSLNSDGFSDIKFRGEYPIGKVFYDDKESPVSVNLEAFSPFIPTDAENSGLPAIVLEYTVKNKTKDKVDVSLAGWLQNTACLFSGDSSQGFHINEIREKDENIQLICSANLNDPKGANNHPDFGNMTLVLIGDGKGDAGLTDEFSPERFYTSKQNSVDSTEISEELIGSIKSDFTLDRNSEKTVRFLLTWYFPNIHKWNGGHNWINKPNLRTYYSSKFKSSTDVANYIQSNPKLITNTKLWNQTWYDSSLDPWFLDRTFINVSTLATTSCVRFDDLTDLPMNEGRFYTFEGVYLGPGTCTHVFHYEQAMGRVFPDLSRQLRQQTDFGSSFRDDGIIAYRAEFSNLGHHTGNQHAIDGHAGTILRAYRDHTMSVNNNFLRYNWPRIKKAIQIMIDQDKAKTGVTDGILEGPQYNTLDRTWYGKITWISGLYASALNAGKEMASEMQDLEFAQKCDRIAKLAFQNLTEELYNGEYYIQKLDPEHLDAPNTNMGCHSEQLLGQYWANQANLPAIFPKENINSAQNSIMKYNFQDNYGKFLERTPIPISRTYADDDESCLVSCTFPKGGAEQAPGKVRNDWEKLVVGYFSECWTGQEHHVAATMIDEGLWNDAMKIEKALHDRYNPMKRNPYNEIEYGNHYTRAMSGYAPFVSASGFTYHGPKGIIGFAPKTTPDNFKSAFITAEGWGSFEQKRSGKKQENSLTLKYGKLKLNQFNLEGKSLKPSSKINVKLNDKKLKIKSDINENIVSITFDTIELQKDNILLISIK